MQIDLNRPVTLEDTKSAARAFAAWWMEHMLALLPSRARLWLDRSLERWTLEISGTSWHLRSAGSASSELELDANETAEALRAHIARLAPTCLMQRIDVRLPKTDILIRNLRLPAATQAHLHNVLELQLDRLSPFRAEDVQFDFQYRNAPEDQEIDVQIGLVPKVRLNDYESRLNAAGLTVRKYLAGDSGLTLRPLRLQFGLQDKLQLALAAVALAFWIGAILLAPVMREAELSSLLRQASQLRPAAQQAAKLRSDLLSVQSPLRAADEMLQRRLPLDILKSLTALLPDTAYIHNLTIEKNSIKMRVETADLPALTARLKQSGEFKILDMHNEPGAAGSTAFVDVELTAIRPARPVKSR